MKSIFNKSWLLALTLVVVALPSCEDITDLNIDPNNPVAVPASNLVTQAQYNLYNTLHGRTLNAEWGMLMTQQFSQTEYAEDSRYRVDATNFSASWDNMYAGVLMELKTAKGLITDNEGLAAGVKANELAIVEILMADAFQTATDMWGDIPYSQALSIEFPNPAYDTQSAIYADLLSKVDAAVASMDESSLSFPSGDIIWNGDVSMWKKTGASLLMRMAMRVADVDAGLAQEYITKAAGYGVISSNDENALFMFDDVNPDLSNPLWIDNEINNRDDFSISSVVVSSLTAAGDPRLAKFANPTSTGEIVGLPYGLTDAASFELQSTTSRPSDMIRSAGRQHVVIDAAEVAFLTAEAIERGFLSGDAEAAFNEGVALSMNYWGISDADGIAAYLEANPYNTDNWKESVGYEKWVNFYANGVQGWAEHRRLDYPVLELPAEAVTNSIPTRLPYPISEDTNNGSNLDAITSDINNITDKVWWDVN